MFKFNRKLTLKVLFSAVIGFGASQMAVADDMYALNKKIGPSSNVAWDIQLTKFVANGDPVRGAKINKEMNCAMCHGEKGISVGRNWPHLAGQLPGYTYKMLIDYRDEKRVDADSSKVMVKLAQQMTEQDMADVAAYYATFPLSIKTPAALAKKGEVDKIVELMYHGDGKRMIPPCLSCHEMKGRGAGKDMPAIAGQRPEYFRKTMLDYKSGVRHNDIYARMRYIAQALTDDEINAMAQFLADLAKPKAQ